MKILAACDGSEGSITALKYLNRLPLKDKAIDLVSVVHSIEYLADQLDPSAIELIESLNTNYKEDAKKALTAALEIFDNNAKSSVLEGDPVHELIKISKNYDLVTMGTRGMGPSKSFFMGSVSDALVRESLCPVLVLPEKVRCDGDTRRQLVVGVDLTKSSKEIFSFLSRFDFSKVASVHLVTVFKQASYALMSGTVSLIDRMARDKADASGELSSFKDKLEADNPKCSVKIATLTTKESAGFELAKYASELNDSLLIVGSGRKKFLDRLLLGSTSRELIHALKIPLVVVR